MSDSVQVGDIYMLHRGGTAKEYYIVVSAKEGNYGPVWVIHSIDGHDDGWELESTLLDRDYYKKVA